MASSAAGALLAETRRKPGRLLLTGLAVTVATVFAAGTLMLAETLRAYLIATNQETPAAASAVVLGEKLPYDIDDPVATVTAVPGVAEAVGVWVASPTVEGVGVGTSWRMTSDPMNGPLTRLRPLVEGRLPANADEVLVGA
jgi:putative ABC transport system permease protein